MLISQIGHLLAQVDALNRRHSRASPLAHPPARYVTALLQPAGGALAIDDAAVAALGIRWA